MTTKVSPGPLPLPNVPSGNSPTDCTPAWHRHHALADVARHATERADAARAAMDSLAETDAAREWWRMRWDALCRVRDSLCAQAGYRMEGR